MSSWHQPALSDGVRLPFKYSPGSPSGVYFCKVINKTEFLYYDGFAHNFAPDLGHTYWILCYVGKTSKKLGR